MANIAELSELASALQVDLDTATANLLLLDLAQGLITELIGEQDPWPKTAKSIALTAAARAYRNPEGVRQDQVGGSNQLYNDPLYRMGVYLSDAEKADLLAWLNGPGGSTVGQPQGSFPASHAWPDPVEWAY
jgi:hypothetical protein